MTKEVEPVATPVKIVTPRGKKPEVRFLVERNRVYLGRASTSRRPAVIRADDVYAAIPSYRKITEKDLTRDDPEYWPLMRKTTVLFVRALRTVCEREGHDLVAESGAIATTSTSGDHAADVPDVTRRVLAALGDEIASTRH